MFIFANCSQSSMRTCLFSVCWVLCCNTSGVQSCVSEAQDVLLWSEFWLLTTGWAVQLDCSVWAELVSWEQWLKGCASVTVLLSFHFMMHVCLFFFSFVRITTYSFLMLLKIPYEFVGMLWWLPCASKVCQFSGRIAVASDSTICRAFTCVLAKK